MEEFGALIVIACHMFQIHFHQTVAASVDISITLAAYISTRKSYSLIQPCFNLQGVQELPASQPVIDEQISLLLCYLMYLQMLFALLQSYYIFIYFLFENPIILPAYFTVRLLLIDLSVLLLHSKLTAIKSIFGSLVCHSIMD